MLLWRNEDAGDLKSPSERSPGSSPGRSTNLFYVVPVNPYTYEPCKTVNEYFEIKKSILEKIDN